MLFIEVLFLVKVIPGKTCVIAEVLSKMVMCQQPTVAFQKCFWRKGIKMMQFLITIETKALKKLIVKKMLIVKKNDTNPINFKVEQRRLKHISLYLLLLFNHYVMSLCESMCSPWTAARQVHLSFTIWNLLKLMSTESVILPNHLILCHPLSLLPSIFPCITSASFWKFSPL